MQQHVSLQLYTELESFQYQGQFTTQLLRITYPVHVSECNNISLHANPRFQYQGRFTTQRNIAVTSRSSVQGNAFPCKGTAHPPTQTIKLKIAMCALCDNYRLPLGIVTCVIGLTTTYMPVARISNGRVLPSA
ncbi:hypothetical protein Bbelb_247140 [Branchiostoma belcheri]|nr:hypothetical protein Bbelb_247140 [Branchiostoma belcheri]